MKINAEDQIPKSTLYLALAVLVFCFIPHMLSIPLWVDGMAVAIIIYKMAASYYAWRLLPGWTRGLLVILVLLGLRIDYGSFGSNGFFIGFLLSFIWLKVLELYKLRDLKALILANFYVIFAVLLFKQELWVFFYLLLALMANFTLLLKLTSPQINLNRLGGKSIKLLLTAIPLSLLLFYLFPRINNPLWQVPTPLGGKVGLSETMSPGNIAELFNDDSTVMRISLFRSKPPSYMRGIVLSIYDSKTWKPLYFSGDAFKPLDELQTQQPDYEVILEPSQNNWLYYQDDPTASDQLLIFSSSYGLMLNTRLPITKRIIYKLVDKKTVVTPLSQESIKQNTQLPIQSNAKLKAWAIQEYAKVNKNPEAFVALLKNYIHQQAFWYKLQPASLGNDRNRMETFWFATREGYCEHYASAVTIILRSVGIPARVVIGYQGGRWNPWGEFMEIRQNDAHAWLEYWQSSQGWTRLDPTSFINSARIEQRIKNQYDYKASQSNRYSWGLGFWTKTSLYLDSLRFFWERWLLFYNQESQANLLSFLGLSHWDTATLLQISISAVIAFIGLISLIYYLQQRLAVDPVQAEYKRLKNELSRWRIKVNKSSTIKQIVDALSAISPLLKEKSLAFLEEYEGLRLKNDGDRKKVVGVFREFRKALGKLKTLR